MDNFKNRNLYKIINAHASHKTNNNRRFSQYGLDSSSASSVEGGKYKALKKTHKASKKNLAKGSSQRAEYKKTADYQKYKSAKDKHKSKKPEYQKYKQMKESSGHAKGTPEYEAHKLRTKTEYKEKKSQPQRSDLKGTISQLGQKIAQNVGETASDVITNVASDIVTDSLDNLVSRRSPQYSKQTDDKFSSTSLDTYQQPSKNMQIPLNEISSEIDSLRNRINALETLVINIQRKTSTS